MGILPPDLPFRPLRYKRIAQGTLTCESALLDEFRKTGIEFTRLQFCQWSCHGIYLWSKEKTCIGP